MKLFYFYLCITALFVSCSSSENNSIRKIEYACFDANSYRTEKKDSVYINLYFTISAEGLIEISNKDDISQKYTYYSFQLTEDEKKKLSLVFNPENKLESYLAKTKLEENSFYAGYYDYYRITYSNETIDSVCIIPHFMSKDLYSAYEILDSILYERKDRKEISQFAVPNSFKNSLQSSYLKSSYLPAIKSVPAFRLEDQYKLKKTTANK